MTHENGKPVDRDKEHVKRKLLDEHKTKLSTNDKVLPDPIDLKESRTEEEASLKIWPQLYLTDFSSCI